MSESWYPECIHCDNYEYRDDLCCCLANKLGLAWHKLLLEIPIVKRFVDKHKYCEGFERRE